MSDVSEVPEVSVTYSSKDLSEVVKSAARAVPARPARPAEALLVLQVSSKSTQVRIHTSDTWWVGSLPSGGPDATWLVSAKALSAALSSITGSKVTLSSSDPSSLTVASGAVSYTFPLSTLTIPAPSAASDVLGSVAGSVLFGAFSKVAAAAASDATNDALRGVRLEMGKDLQLVATDRYRLAVATLSYSKAEEDVVAGVTVPTSAAAALSSFSGVAKVGLAVPSGKALEVSGGHLRCSVQALSGEYPAWRKLLKTSPGTTTRFSPEELSAALGRLVAVRQDRSSALLEIFEDKMVLSGGSPVAYSETLSCVSDGQIALRFNPQHLKVGLYGEVMSMHTTSPSKAALLRSPGWDYMIMPVKG